MSTNSFRKWHCEICNDWVRRRYAKARGWIEIQHGTSHHLAQDRPWVCAGCAEYLAPTIATSHIRDESMTPETIRRLREQAKMTQAQLAEVLDVKSQTVSMWECGRLPIRKVVDLAIRQTFGRTR